MNPSRLLCLALLGSLLPFGSTAHEYYAKGFTLIHPWAEATKPDVKQAAIYMKFEQVSEKDRLLSAETRFAGKVELHSGPEADAGRQKPLRSIELPAGRDTELAPGGRYLLLRDLKVPLEWGRSYEMTLRFEKGGEVPVMVSIGAH
jgi:copper(I)-binding protein